MQLLCFVPSLNFSKEFQCLHQVYKDLEKLSGHLNRAPSATFTELIRLQLLLPLTHLDTPTHLVTLPTWKHLPRSPLPTILPSAILPIVCPVNHSGCCWPQRLCVRAYHRDWAKQAAAGRCYCTCSCQPVVWVFLQATLRVCGRGRETEVSKQASETKFRRQQQQQSKASAGTAGDTEHGEKRDIHVLARVKLKLSS